MPKDENGVPKHIEVPVFYMVDNDGDIIYDEEEMKKAFDELISDLPQYKNERRG